MTLPEQEGRLQNPAELDPQGCCFGVTCEQDTGRSAATTQQQVPRSQQKRWGERAFPIAGPHLWNSVPAELPMMSDLTSFEEKLQERLYFLRKLRRAGPRPRRSGERPLYRHHREARQLHC